MAQQADSRIKGSCLDCGKVYNLPHANKIFDCKACGGEVHPNVEDEEEEEFEEEEGERHYTPNEER
ncbi:MAG: putative nucleic acid-binding Zn-ribbon protein, partial [Planctomycetota bacterium]